MLNPNLKKLSVEKINEISNESIKNRKIKEIELTKFIDINKENLGKKYVENFLISTKFKDMKNLLTQLNGVGLKYN